MKATAYSRRPISIHPKGFPIYLSPEEIETCDEYKESDPYTVEVNIDSGFHQGRIACTLAMVEEAINKPKVAAKLLDLGCGQGHITARIKQSHPGAEISALDYSVTAIEYAVGHFPGIDFAVGNVYDCPCQDGYFDVVVCNNIWEHVPDPLRLLAEVKRVTRPGGFAIISTPSRYRLANLVRVLMGKRVVLVSEHHVTEYSVGQVLEQLAHGGFKAVKVFSPPVAGASLKYRLASVIFSPIISMTGSHHQLGSTVFYLCQSK